MYGFVFNITLYFVAFCGMDCIKCIDFLCSLRENYTTKHNDKFDCIAANELRGMPYRK